MSFLPRAKWIAALLGLLPLPTFAQQPAPASPSWEQMPRMQLERQYAGPLKDTVIQRWRDPAEGTVCYIYLPITAQHTPPTPTGYVQYGANTIGAISCVEPAKTSGPPGAASSSAPPSAAKRAAPQTPPSRAAPAAQTSAPAGQPPNQ